MSWKNKRKTVAAALAFGLAATVIGNGTGLAQSAPTGYWRYVTHAVSPSAEEIRQMPKTPGRLEEREAEGAVDIPGGRASLSSKWNADDIDRKVYAIGASFGISANQALTVLVPGTKIAVSGSASVSGNAAAAAMPADATLTLQVDTGDYTIALNNLKVGQSDSSKGEFTVPGGGEGATMTITMTNYLGSYGAFGSKLVLQYAWQSGPAPAVAAPTPAAAGAGMVGPAKGGGLEVPGSQTASPVALPGGGEGSAPTAEPAAVSAMTLQIGKRRVPQGQTITVPVWLLKAQSVANMNFNVRYDPAVASAAAGGVKGNLLDRALFELNPGESGTARVGFAQNSDLSGDGTVAQLVFQATGAAGARTPLTLEVTTISGAAGGQPAIALIHGEILVVGPDGQIPGDADGDGQVTARDAGDALKMSVRLVPVKMVCDVDGDRQVTSTDARLILAKVTGK